MSQAAFKVIPRQPNTGHRVMFFNQLLYIEKKVQILISRSSRASRKPSPIKCILRRKKIYSTRELMLRSNWGIYVHPNVRTFLLHYIEEFMFHMLSISFKTNILRISNTKRAARGPNENRKAEENLIRSFRRSLSFYQDSEWNTCVWENGFGRSRAVGQKVAPSWMWNNLRIRWNKIILINIEYNFKFFYASMTSAHEYPEINKTDQNSSVKKIQTFLVWFKTINRLKDSRRKGERREMWISRSVWQWPKEKI